MKPAPAPKPQSFEDVPRSLEDFLLSAFSEPEMRLLARRIDRHLPLDLPMETTTRSLASHLVDALARRGLVDGELIRLLRSERPARSEQIDALASALTRMAAYPSEKARGWFLRPRLIVLMMSGAPIILASAVAVLRSGSSDSDIEYPGEPTVSHPTPTPAALQLSDSQPTPGMLTLQSDCADCQRWCLDYIIVSYSSSRVRSNVAVSYKLENRGKIRSPHVRIPPDHISNPPPELDFKVLNSTSREIFLTDLELEFLSFMPPTSSAIYAVRTERTTVLLRDLYGAEKLRCDVALDLVSHDELARVYEGKGVPRYRTVTEAWRSELKLELGELAGLAQELAQREKDLVFGEISCATNSGTEPRRPLKFVAPFLNSSYAADQIPACWSDCERRCKDNSPPPQPVGVPRQEYKKITVGELSKGEKLMVSIGQYIAPKQADWFYLSIGARHSGTYVFKYRILEVSGRVFRAGRLSLNLIGSGTSPSRFSG